MKLLLGRSEAVHPPRADDRKVRGAGESSHCSQQGGLVWGWRSLVLSSNQSNIENELSIKSVTKNIKSHNMNNEIYITKNYQWNLCNHELPINEINANVCCLNKIIILMICVLCITITHDGNFQPSIKSRENSQAVNDVGRKLDKANLPRVWITEYRVLYNVSRYNYEIVFYSLDLLMKWPCNLKNIRNTEKYWDKVNDFPSANPSSSFIQKSTLFSVGL